MKNKIIFTIYILLIIILGFNFGSGGFWFVLFSAFVGVVILFGRPNKDTDLKISKYFLLIPLLVIFISHLLPFYLYGQHPLGYDTGFYKYNIVKEREHNLGDVRLSIYETAGARLTTKFLLALGLSDEAILYWFYIATFLATGLAIYFLVKNYFGISVAFISSYIYSLSFVQYLFFWNILWKNSLTILLMLIVFYLLEQNRKIYYLLILPLIIFIFITHKTSAFILFVTLIIYFLFKKDKNKFWLIPLITLGAGVVSWYNRKTIVILWEQIRSNFTAHYDFFMVKEGIFIDGQQFLNYSFLYLPFSLLAVLILIANYKKNKAPWLILTFFSVCALLIISKLVFYKRIIPFFDVSLIIFAGLGLYWFVKKIANYTSLKYSYVFLLIFLFLPLFPFFNQVIAQKPLMQSEQIKGIEELKNKYPQSVIFTYNSYFTPWLYGFSGHKIMAPGWGDKWTLARWNIFWGSGLENRKKMLLEVKIKEMIIYDSGDGFFKLENDKCFQRLTKYYYKFNCK